MPRFRPVFATVLGALFCFWGTSPASAARNRPNLPPPEPVVSIKSILDTEVYDPLLYPAKVVSRVNASIRAETDGVVQAIRKPLGSRVAASEPVLILTNPDPVYTYAPFQVLAPVSGVISQISVTQGSRVTRGDLLGSITDPSQIQVRIEVTVADLAAVHSGMLGSLELSESTETREIKVSGVSPLVDPLTGTASAELVLTDQKKPLPPGAVGRVRFKARLHKGIEVPESAVFYRGEQAMVRVLQENKALFRPVKLGPSRQGKFEILEGLKSGETVVLRVNTFINDGESVKVEPTTEKDT